MATSYHIFCDPGSATFEEMSNAFVSFTEAQLVATTSGSGRQAFDVYLPDRNRFLAHSTLPGAAERLAHDGPTRADFMAWDEPGDHYYFDEPDDDWYAFRSHRFQFTLDVYFEEDTQEMRDYAWAIAAECASRWPTVVIYNMEQVWALGSPEHGLRIEPSFTGSFMGAKVIGDTIPGAKAAGEALNPERWL